MKLFKLTPCGGVKNGLKIITLSAFLIIFTFGRLKIFPWKSKYFEIGIYIFSGFIILVGVGLIFLDIIPRIYEKYFPTSFNKSQAKHIKRKSKAK